MAGLGNHIVTQEPIGKVKISSLFANDLQLNDSMDGLGNDPSDPFNQHINLTTIGKNQDDSDDSMDYDANENMSEKVAFSNKPRQNEAIRFDKYQGLTDEELDAQLAEAIQNKNLEEHANRISTINEDSRDLMSGENSEEDCDVPSSKQSEIPDTVRQNFDNFDE